MADIIIGSPQDIARRKEEKRKKEEITFEIPEAFAELLAKAIAETEKENRSHDVNLGVVYRSHRSKASSVDDGVVVPRGTEMEFAVAVKKDFEEKRNWTRVDIRNPRDYKTLDDFKLLFYDE